MKSGKQPMNYNVRWYDRTNGKQIANVSIMASSDTKAVKATEKLSIQMGLPTSKHDIYQGNRHVESYP